RTASRSWLSAGSGQGRWSRLSRGTPQASGRQVSMKRILLDTNILLDVVLARKPHAEAGEALWEMIEEHNAEGRLAAHAVTTFYYMVRKQRDHVRAKQAVHSLL